MSNDHNENTFRKTWGTICHENNSKFMQKMIALYFLEKKINKQTLLYYCPIKVRVKTLNYS